MTSYDQWKTASPWDDDDPIILVTVELEKLGRVGHGLAGKNADLDPGGQVRVLSAWVELDRPVPIAVAKISAYANICCPEEADRAETAEFIVCDETRWDGEWTGSDYWTFGTGELDIRIELPWLDPLEDIGDNVDREWVSAPCLSRIVHALYSAIFQDDEIKTFRSAMAELSARIDAIEPIED